ncbi:MAG: polysaccharide pyruvyl transferase family protein [Anaerolineaceae bacterium]|jgi:colanic acid/amylovoran biosynthesis protein
MKNNMISFMGGSVWGNRGAEAMLMTSMARILRFSPGAQFNIYSIYPKEDSKLVSKPNIHFYSGEPLSVALVHFPFALLYWLFKRIRITLPLPKPLAALKNSDCLLDIGGITFSDGRTVQLLYNVLTILPAYLLGVPIIKMSQATGPFRTSINKRLAKHILPLCQKIFSRGYLSSNYLDQLLGPGNYFQAADIAFLFNAEDSLSVENEDKVAEVVDFLKRKRGASTLVVSVAPSSLVLKKSLRKGIDYPGRLLNLLLATQDRNIHFIYLPNGSRQASTEIMNNDIIAIQAVRQTFTRELPHELLDRVTWIDYDINTRGVRDLIAQTDLLITSRFHAMIAGLSLCVPTMVIGWSHKYRETLQDFQMAEFAIDYQHESVQITRLFLKALTNLEEMKVMLQSHLSNVKQSSLIQFNYLQEFLNL